VPELTQPTEKSTQIESFALWADQICSVCGGKKKKRIYASNIPGNASVQDLRAMFWGHYKDGGTKKFNPDIYSCLSCRHVFAHPYLSDDALKFCYTFAEFDNTWEVDTSVLMQTVSCYLEMAGKNKPDSDLLVDVGCDIGLMLESGIQQGFKKVIGIEPNKMAAEQAAKRLASHPSAQVLNTVYDSTLIPPGTASMVTFIHVLDHIRQPKLVLEAAHRQLKPGGIVAAVTHNIDSVLAKVSQQAFPALNLQHPQYFSPKTIAKVMEQNGFKVLGVYPTANHFPLSHYIHYMPFLPSSFKRVLIKLLAAVGLGSLTLGLRLGNMMVIAQKPRVS
jgi:2-polyprenyl-3-methyl-5-hydroxy-6-metoxy-1,4-benzoquinol methylase